MPDITIWNWPRNDDTIVSTSVSSAIHFNSTSSALSFGSTAFQGNITIGQYNSYFAHAADNTQTSTELVTLHNFTWVAGEGNSTAYVLDPGEHGGPVTSAASTGRSFFKNGSPLAWRGLGFRFNFSTTAVNCSPVYCWAGTGADVDGPTQNCVVNIADLTLDSSGAGTSASDGKKHWVESTASNKLVCSAHTGTAANQHWWTFALSLSPTQVGFNNSNKVKFEVTYY